MCVQEFEKLTLKQKINYTYNNGVWIKSTLDSNHCATTINKVNDFYVRVYLSRPGFKIERIAPVIPTPGFQDFIPIGKLL